MGNATGAVVFQPPALPKWRSRGRHRGGNARGEPMAELHEGGCLCRSIRYQVEGEPVRTTLCHCTFCQHVTGSAFVADALFPKEAVSIEGTFSTYDHESDQSGYLITIQFCPRCGTTFGMTFERFPDVQGIMIGTLDDPNWPGIDKHQFTRSAFRWMQFPPEVPLFEDHPNPARKPDR